MPGAVTVDFNGGTAPSSGFATYTPGDVRPDSASGLYASPLGDTTPYFTIGTSNSTPATASFSGLADYFGLYWGSIDAYNSVSFLRNGTTIKSYSGNAITAVADGDQGVGRTNRYVNFFASGPSEYFDQVVFSSTSNAFETDNHAYGIASVPEQSSSIAILTAGLLGGVTLLKFELTKRRSADLT